MMRTSCFTAFFVAHPSHLHRDYQEPICLRLGATLRPVQKVVYHGPHGHIVLCGLSLRNRSRRGIEEKSVTKLLGTNKSVPDQVVHVLRTSRNLNHCSGMSPVAVTFCESGARRCKERNG